MSPLLPANTLITNTPEEGRELAIRIARLTVKATQPDETVRRRLRDAYANDALLLVMITQSVAIEFATIAAANRYWSAPS